jgi:galactokinase
LRAADGDPGFMRVAPTAPPWERLREEFAREFGDKPRVFRAPGRINLIGEHTDYNEGFVLPLAIDRELRIAAATRRDRVVRVSSATLDRTVEFELDHRGQARTGTWIDYVRGMALAIEGQGTRLAGANLLVAGDLPLGAGLSSSAALEVGTGLALCSLANLDIDARALALLAVAAEHTYVGTHCGAMDQLTVALGRRDHALFIDCRVLEPVPIPRALDGAELVVCDTGVKHELSRSGYNDRRVECERAVQALAPHLAPDLEVRALRDLDVEHLAQLGSMLPPKLAARVRHVVTENARVIAARAAIEMHDLVTFGRLMYASHASLRDDFEVSCLELDVVVETAQTMPGVLGARMTGGGFGGSAIALCAAGHSAGVAAALSTAFARRFGRTPATFNVRASDGASEVRA